MALFPCSECGKPVSEKAKTCPSCGAPVVVPRKAEAGNGCVTVFGFIALCFFGYVWFTHDGKNASNVAERSQQSSSVPALDKMAVVFVGGYSKAQIKERMDRAMTMYKVPLTEEEYNRCGSVLVKMRTEYGVPEMHILDYMIRSNVGDLTTDFAGMAAMSTMAIKAGDR